MNSSVILVSSDSSAPSSPVPGTGTKLTFCSTDEHCPDSNARSDSIVDYIIPVNRRKQLEDEDNYRGSYETSSLLEVNSKNTVECAEIQLSDSDAESDTTVDYYSPVTFVNEMLSNSTSQVHDVSASSTDVLQKVQKEVQHMDYEYLDDKAYVEFISIINLLVLS
jgi:hypothetical protein